MAYYFRFNIPSGISYSPNWFGTMPKCPKNVEVLLYNDKEGYGIAKTEDKFKPKEVTVIEEAEALSTSYEDGTVSFAPTEEVTVASETGSSEVIDPNYIGGMSWSSYDETSTICQNCLQKYPNIQLNLVENK